MYNINKVTIEGNLTRVPEMKVLPSGQNVTSMSIATNRKYKKKDGELQEEVEFHNVVVWGNQAESVSKYLTKGSSALVEGRLQTRSWDKDGTTMYRTEVVADNVTFGAKPQVQTVADTTVPYPADEINPEDIPF